ncbi:MAG: aspartate/glutamate racemase family protein [Patescibacteria group bacterium]
MIGIFDSGSGGLGVLGKIRKRLPRADFVYLGDIKNAPYGERTREELGALTVLDIEKLLNEGVTKIISACNSVSASVMLPMLSILGVRPFDLVEMVGPTVKALRNEKRKILLLATPATVSSGIYRQGFAMIDKKIGEVAIPDLAGMIEFGASEKEMAEVIRKAIGEEKGFGVLLLGCTHYPLIKNIFEKVLQKLKVKAEIIDPAGFVAAEVVKTMAESGTGKTKFLITKESGLFRKRVAEMFGENGVEVEVI